jgi:hypothetical protein
VATVLATRTKVRGFKFGRGQWIFKEKKIRSTTSFGGEVKPSTPCLTTLWNFGDPCGVCDKNTLPAKLTDISREVSHCFTAMCSC